VQAARNLTHFLSNFKDRKVLVRLHAAVMLSMLRCDLRAQLVCEQIFSCDWTAASQ